MDLKFESFAFSRSFFADVEFLWTARLKSFFTTKRPASQEHTRPHRMGVSVSYGGQDQVDYASPYRNLSEPYHGIQGVHLRRLKGATMQFDVFGWGPGLSTHQTITPNAYEIEAVHWNWNPNPDVTPYNAPAVGPTVYIHPGYEGIAVGGLTEISPAPDEMYDVRELDPKLALETDLAYQPTWPKFTTGRRRFSLRWNGITSLERDTIAAYTAIESLRTFKWTRPGQAALALLPVSDMRSRSLGGGLYVAELSVVELIHLAP